MRTLLFSPSGEHAPMLGEVERLAWSSDGEHISADIEKIHARIDVYPAGITLATVDGVSAGSQYAFRFRWPDSALDALTTWDNMTCKGWYNQVHDGWGNTGFLVGVGVVPQFRGMRFAHHLRWPGEYKLSELLIARTLDSLFAAGVQCVVGCARVPVYHQHKELSIHEYCSLRRTDHTLFDPVLRFHERMGARIIKPVAYAMDDADSLNAGCWVLYDHRFNG